MIVVGTTYVENMDVGMVWVAAVAVGKVDIDMPGMETLSLELLDVGMVLNILNCT